MPGSRLHGREGWRPVTSVPVLGQAASGAPALPSFPDFVAQSLCLLQPAALTLVGGQGCHDTAGPRRGEGGERQEQGGECLTGLVASGRPPSIAKSQGWQLSPERASLPNEHKHDLLLTLRRCCKPERDVFCLALPGLL